MASAQAAGEDLKLEKQKLVSAVAFPRSLSTPLSTLYLYLLPGKVDSSGDALSRHCLRHIARESRAMWRHNQD